MIEETELFKSLYQKQLQINLTSAIFKTEKLSLHMYHSLPQLFLNPFRGS